MPLVLGENLASISGRAQQFPACPLRLQKRGVQPQLLTHVGRRADWKKTRPQMYTIILVSNQTRVQFTWKSQLELTS